MKDVYIVFTNFNLYLTLLKVNYDFKTFGKRADLILTDHLVNPLPKDMLKGLHQLKLFDNIFIINDYAFQTKINQGGRKALFFYKSRVLKYMEKEFERVGFHPFETNYDKIFIFIEASYSAQFFLIKKRSLHLIEDGMDAYNEYTEDWHLKLRYLLGFPRKFGLSKHVRGYWVIEPNKMPEVLKNKVVHYNLSQYKKKIDKHFTQMLFDIYMHNGSSIVKDLQENINSKKTFLLLTQWFSELGFMTEEEKIEIYKKIIKKYAKDDHIVIIKPHPKERTDYALYFPNTIIMPAAVPIEIIANSFVFDLCVTIDSGGILHMNCKEKIHTKDEFNEEGWKRYMKGFGFSTKKNMIQ